MMLALPLARLTVRNAVRKSLFSEVLKASVIVRKLAVEVFDCVPKVGRNRLSAVHDATNLAKT
jgi:hypothetical protein